MFGKNKTKKVSGFQMNRKTGHTSYAFRQNQDKVKSIGFTHNKDDRADKVQLKHNINPKDSSDCFAKTKVEEQRYNTYRNKPEYANYRVHNDDKKTIAKIIKDNKKRR